MFRSVNIGEFTRSNINDDYRMDKTLGVGAFGSVRLATKRNNRTGHKYAIKLISKAKIGRSDAK